MSTSQTISCRCCKRDVGIVCGQVAYHHSGAVICPGSGRKLRDLAPREQLVLRGGVGGVIEGVARIPDDAIGFIQANGDDALPHALEAQCDAAIAEATSVLRRRKAKEGR